MTTINPISSDPSENIETVQDKFDIIIDVRLSYNISVSVMQQ